MSQLVRLACPVCQATWLQAAADVFGTGLIDLTPGVFFSARCPCCLTRWTLQVSTKEDEDAED